MNIVNADVFQPDERLEIICFKGEAEFSFLVERISRGENSWRGKPAPGTGSCSQ